MFAAARRNVAPESAGVLQIEHSWAESFHKRHTWDEAKTHYDRALAEATRLDTSLTRAGILFNLGRMYIDRLLHAKPSPTSVRQSRFENL